MVGFDREILKVLVLSLATGCASNNNLTVKESQSCENLMKSIPEAARIYVKDGCYNIGNKSIYKIGDRCYEAIKDTLKMRIGHDTIKIEYWR
jgi:hypothetical protein